MSYEKPVFIVFSIYPNEARDFWEGEGGFYYKKAAQLARDLDCPISDITRADGAPISFALPYEQGIATYNLFSSSYGWKCASKDICNNPIVATGHETRESCFDIIQLDKTRAQEHHASN